MTYSEAKNIINNRLSLGIKSGLSRIYALLDEMGNPQNELCIIHIAGTNGKGTVAKTIADAIRSQGYKVGLFTSPWVVDYREQIQINGEFIPQEALAQYIEKYHDNDCSEFELLTAIMYRYFRDSAVDYAVIECGMGGLGDATNTERTNIASVITSLSIDHTGFLGETIEQIAEQKSGIIRPNSICAVYPDISCRNIIERKCNELNTRFVEALHGDDFNACNLNLVNALLTSLGFDTVSELSRLPARQERINGVLLDGGHNVEAGKSLSKLLENEVAVIGMMKDKDVEGYLSSVAPRCKAIITTTPDNPRSISAQELKEIAQRYCSKVVSEPSPIDALELAKGMGLTLVCGSFYLARQLRKEL